MLSRYFLPCADRIFYTSPYTIHSANKHGENQAVFYYNAEKYHHFDLSVYNDELWFMQWVGPVEGFRINHMKKDGSDSTVTREPTDFKTYCFHVHQQGRSKSVETNVSIRLRYA